MLLDKEVEITLNNRTIPYFESLGYEIPKYKDKDYRWRVRKGTKIIVKVEDLNEGSKAEVRIRCDYCGKAFRKKYQDYLKQKRESLVNKDCCADCRNNKVKEVVYEKYGVDSIFQTEEMRKIVSERNRLDCNYIRIQFLERGLVPAFSDSDYKDCNSPLKYFCREHPDIVQTTSVASFIHNKNAGCRYCSRAISKPELIISEYLKSQGFNFKFQYTFPQCRNKKPLPFDFAVFDEYGKILALIEFDGEHHFRPIRFAGMSEEEAIKEFEKRKKNDEIKTRFCKKNGIRLIRIPYWDIENIQYILGLCLKKEAV